LEAYDLYLQAKHLFEANVWALHKNYKDIYGKIISLLEEATQKDGTFALAYCLIAKAHDILYTHNVDKTPERRALGEAAVNIALRLRPELPEAHLAAATHLFYCYRDFERARVQIAIAAQALPNSPEVLELTALIDLRQGRWQMATLGLEKAATLDPRNLELLDCLSYNYWNLRRYEDLRRIVDRQIEIDPNQPLIKIGKALIAFDEKADLDSVRAALEALPSSAKDDPVMADFRILYAVCARDFSAAERIVNESSNELYFAGTLVPRQIYLLWIESLRGNHPTIEQFGAAREQLYQKAEADPTNPFLFVVLSLVDIYLGRKEESLREGQRAVEIRPISEDAIDGPTIALHLAMLYSLAGQVDFAFQQLEMLVKIPGGHSVTET
jgi:tetratricopeptide (TPR) repeat protein